MANGREALARCECDHLDTAEVEALQVCAARGDVDQPLERLMAVVDRNQARRAEGSGDLGHLRSGRHELAPFEGHSVHGADGDVEGGGGSGVVRHSVDIAHLAAEEDSSARGVDRVVVGAHPVDGNVLWDDFEFDGVGQTSAFAPCQRLDVAETCRPGAFGHALVGNVHGGRFAVRVVRQQIDLPVILGPMAPDDSGE